jgi:predicted RNA-binding protein YlxR (DUF448 family)
VAVVSTAATEASAHLGPGPIRTCIGCRKKAVAAELFRVVVAKAPSGTGSGRQLEGGEPVVVAPDPGRSAPGRGAWLHPDPACAQLAQRRRAYARALRVPGTVDPAPVLAFFAREFGAHEFGGH